MGGDDHDRLEMVIQMERGADGKIDEKMNLGSAVHKFDATTINQVTPLGYNVVGDANVNGTLITSMTLAANKSFSCTQLYAGVNVGSVLLVGVGALGDMVDYYIIDLTHGLTLNMAVEQIPIFVIPAATTAQTINIYAPQIAYGVAVGNNAVIKFFNAWIGGIKS